MDDRQPQNQEHMMAAGAWKAKMGTHSRVGAQLKDYRAKYELTQAALAKSIGCAPSAISSIERGKCGSMELMEGVLWALGLDLADLKMGKGALDRQTDMLAAERAKRRRGMLNRNRFQRHRAAA